MCEQSNTYTITTRPRLLPMILIMVLSWLSFNFALAQTDVSIHPLEQSKVRSANVDVFVYGAGSIASILTSYLISNNINGDLYASHINVGVSADVYYLEGSRFCASFGYINKRYSYGFDNTGINTHWLTAELGLSGNYGCVGAYTAVFLNSQIKNDNHFSYNGIYSSCFNPITFGVFMGGAFGFSGIKIEARMGYSLLPDINPNQFAYYNFQSLSIPIGFYWELRLSCRCFSTGRRSKSLISDGYNLKYNKRWFHKD